MTDVVAPTRTPVGASAIETPPAVRRRAGRLPIARAAFGLELRLWWRQPVAVAAGFLVPAVAAVVISLALGAHPKPKATWALVDLEHGPVSQGFDQQVLGNETLHDLLSVKRVGIAEARRLVRDNAVDAAIVLPADLTSETAAGRPPQLQVIAPSRRQFGTDLADLVAHEFTVRAWAAATVGSAEVADAPRWPLEVEVLAATGKSLDVAGHYGPSIGMFFMLMTLGFAAQTQVKHRELGVTDRLRSTGPHSAMLVFGRAAAGALIGGLSLVTTLAVMTAIFGHSWGGLVPLAVLIALVVFAFAGIGALIGALPRTSNQAVLLAIAVPFAFALASGTFSPPDAPVRPSGAWFAPPTHALDAFAEIAVTHAGLGAIAGELVFLVAAGVLGGLASLIVELRR